MYGQCILSGDTKKCTVGREIEKAPTENQKKCNTKNSWNQNTVRIAWFWLHNQYSMMEMLLKMRCRWSFLWFSTFLDLYSSLCLLISVETTLVSVTPASLATRDDHRQLLTFWEAGLGFFAGCIAVYGLAFGWFDFPWMHLFFRFLIHCFIHWNIEMSLKGIPASVTLFSAKMRHRKTPIWLEVVLCYVL